MHMFMKIKIIWLFLVLLALFPIQTHAQTGATDGTTNYTPEKISLLERVEALEKKEFLKMLRPGKDIEFLYESVVGYGVHKIEKTPECINELKDYADKAVKYRLSTIFLRDELQDITGSVVKGTTMPILCKLAAVEKILGTSGTAGSTTKARINHAYTAINNTDWKSDRLRFGLKAADVDKLNGISTSIILHAYPTYRRFMPGRLDLIRRTSFFVSAGTLTDEGDEVETKGPIYSAGLGFDVAKGFTVLVGYSLYQKKEKGGTTFSQGESIEYGISLTSELWKGLFNQK